MNTPISKSVTVSSQTIDDITIAVSNTYSSGIDYNTEDLSITVVGNSPISRSIDIAWDINSASPIPSTLMQYTDYPLPQWVSLDSLNPILSMNTPKLASKTKFKLLIRSTIASVPYDKLVTIIIEPECNVANWLQCVGIDENHCHKCQDKYKLYEHASKWVLEQKTAAVTASTAISQSAVGVGVAASTAVSVLSMSSPQAVWIMGNQFQLLMLLPLTEVFVPKDIEDYFTGMSFLSFDLSFIPFSATPLINSVFSYFEFEQEDEYLQEIGMQYGSSILNQFSMIFMISLLMILHVTVILSYRIIDKDESTRKYKILSKLMDLFLFTIYVRTFVEALQMMMLSSLIEIKTFDTSEISRVFSILISFLFTLLCVGLIVLMAVEWIRSKDPKIFKQQKYFKEVFSGVKDKWRARCYMLLNFGRRAIFIIAIVFPVANPIHTIIIFAIIQVVYYATVIYLRPLDCKKGN